MIANVNDVRKFALDVQKFVLIILPDIESAEFGMDFDAG
jgi:hypothetical protein